jgi:hypothetical protein
MEKIAREQNQYYLIGFTPADSEEGSCHTLHLKLDKGGTNVRSRSGYCNVHQVDVLAGKPAETELESIAAGQAKGNLGSPLQMPFFYTSPNVARVNLAMELPSEAFKFTKVKGKLHSEMNLLGMAYRKDNSVGAKFSDTLKFDFDNNIQVEEFHKKPFHYESQFEVASGDYNMKVVFSAGGENFGKIEKPLVVDPFDGKQFSMSALAFSTEMIQIQAGDDSGLDAVLIEDKVPLVAKLPTESFQIVPSADYHFAASDRVVVYMEIYDAALADEKAPDVGFSVKLVDQKTGEQKLNSGNVSLKNFQRPGSTSVPAIFNVPVKDLPPGAYHAEVTTLDTAGKTATRTADFTLDPPKVLGLGWDKK